MTRGINYRQYFTSILYISGDQWIYFSLIICLTLFVGILQQRIELDKECMFQYTQLRKEVRLMDGQTSVAPVLMRFQRGCQQVRLEIICSPSTDIKVMNHRPKGTGQHI